MTERYTKAGAAVRFEVSGDHRAFLRIVERGWAETAGERFSAGSGSPLAVPLLEESREQIEAHTMGIASRIPKPLEIERLTLTTGVATHEVSDAQGRRTWNDAQTRLHVTLVNRPRHSRATVDLGSAGAMSIDGRPIERAIAALAAIRRGSETLTSDLRLEPVVTAALCAALAPRVESATGIRIEQTPYERSPFDGSGKRIGPVDAPPENEWPNAFRPSYRVVPKPAPFHVRFAGAPLLDGTAPALVAVALTAPPRVLRDAVMLEMLVVSEDGASRAMRVLDSVAGWMSKVRGASQESIWFPAGAGAFGCTLDLSDVLLET
ncbi:MAG: hypothetical protein ACYC7A_13345 [Thermoanaerobaculia bacterium]